MPPPRERGALTSRLLVNRFPGSKCLSLGPSQGIVYELSEKTIVKLPFQYPTNDVLSTDTASIPAEIWGFVT